MEKEQLLRNPDVFPSDKVLAAALGDSYTAYKAFAEHLPGVGAELEWRYYNDGKNWLGKCVYKKKTVFWLSAWNGFFKVTFFFNEKTRQGVYNLDIHKDLIKSFEQAKHLGKIMPLTIEVYDESPLNDACTLIEYKKNLR